MEYTVADSSYANNIIFDPRIQFHWTDDVFIKAERTE